MRTPLFYVGLLAALLASASRASPVPLEVQASVSEAPAAKVEYRLSGDVRPTAYGLFLSPRYPSGVSLFGTKGFDGVVAIDMEIVQRTDKLELHRGETITDVKVECAAVLSDPIIPDPSSTPSPDPSSKPNIERNSNLNPDSNHNTASADAADRERHLYAKAVEMCVVGRPLLAVASGWNRATEKLTVQLDSALPVGTRLRVVFSYEAGFPGGALTGFYVSNYTSDGKNASVLATNFLPTHARKAFPCFDEPAYKATFDLSFQLKDRLDAIANTPQANRRADHVVIFQTTPPLSTYQLAFLVYEVATFDSAEAWASATTHLITWARREALRDQAAAISLNAGLQMQLRMEIYTQIALADTGVPYVQQVALPDLQSPAVENYGIAMARENALLSEQDGPLVTGVMQVAFTVAREMAHQWFGNLVTTHWWNTTWLNEGFPEYMKYVLIERTKPSWWITEQMVVEQQMSVFQVDSTEDVTALSVAGVHTPDEIANRFGAISSSKGAAILRQIENVMGEKDLNLALRDFLNDRKFSDATPDHLFYALLKNNNETRTKLDNQKLLAVLKGWTETPGYPVLFVNRTGPFTFRVSQRRFLQNGEVGAEKYHVPLTWTTSRTPAHWVEPPPPPMGWLFPEDEEREFTFPTLTDDEWVLFNVDQGGYYRVQYDEASWEALEMAYRDKDIVEWPFSRVDRAGLMDNAVALARAGMLSWRRAMCMVAAGTRDNQPVPWAASRQALAPLERLLRRRPQFKAFMNFMMGKAFRYWSDNFPTDERDVREAKHQVMLLDWSCSVGYEPSLQKTKELLRLHLNGYRVNPDALSVALCHGQKGDDGSLWEQLWNEYQVSDSARRSAMIPALGCSDHAPSLRRYLESSLNPWVVRGQDASSVFMAVIANPEDVALEVALQFFEETGYEALQQAYGQVGNAMDSIVDAMARRMTEPSQKDQLERALGPHAQQHASALRAVEANAQWLREHETDVLEAMARCAAAAVAAPAALLLLGLLLAILRLPSP